MSEQFGPIQELLDRVRARWRRLVLLDVTTRAATAGVVIVGLALVLAHWMSRAPVALAVVGVSTLVAGLTAIAWAAWPARHVPSDRKIARFIEEREPSLDERLVSAVDVATVRSSDERPAFAGAMVRDAAKAAAGVDAAAIVPREALQRRAARAVVACLLLSGMLFASRHVARQAFDAVALLLFPSRIVLEVTPGNTRVQAGSGLTVEAHLVGNTAPVVAQLLRAASGSDDWQPTEMETDGQGHFRLALQSLTSSFRYKVLAGSAASPAFDVAVLRAPRVARIDVAYAYPQALGLAPRVEEDGGDIYGPEGTKVKVTVHTDAPVTTGRMVLGPDTSLNLSAESPTTLSGSLQISENGSYRVTLADADGMKSQGDTEYFIRILDDRPPEVHVVRPASDRRVTRLEEVEITAEAQDDFGVSALELVYAVRGGAEKVVPLGIAPRSTSVTGHYVMYLEDIDVTPGDFISYYVRARDLPRGKRASESRSDIFFLEVKPFEEEFTLAQTQAAMGGGSGNPQLDDLVAAQKEIVVATWKLDRRSRDAQGAKSEQDIRAVSKSEAELKQRVEQTSSASANRRCATRGGRGRTARGQASVRSHPHRRRLRGTPRVGQAMPEEDAMTTASNAMGKAITSLNALKTSDALPHEMEALNALLKAQADVKKRQIQRQQAGNGAGSNRSTEDLSSLFDKELAKNQQTNYENKTSAEQTEDKNASSVDRIKDLARRQDELVRSQQEFARNQNQMSADEQKRQLDSLSREQNDLRERAEQVAKQLQQAGQQQQGGQQGEPGQQGQKSQSGQPSGQPGQSAGQQGQAGQSGQRRPASSQNARQVAQGPEGGQQGTQQMRDISEEMRNAANDLKRQDTGPGECTRRACARAAARTRTAASRRARPKAVVERSAICSSRRGNLQTRSGRLRPSPAGGRDGQASRDMLRRLAGEQERLAERLQRVQDGLQQVPHPPRRTARDRRASAGRARSCAGIRRDLQQAAADAANDIERQRLAERMQQSAEAMRQAASGQSTSTPTVRPRRVRQRRGRARPARPARSRNSRVRSIGLAESAEPRRHAAGRGIAQVERSGLARARPSQPDGRSDASTRGARSPGVESAAGLAADRLAGAGQAVADGRSRGRARADRPGSCAAAQLRADIGKQMQQVRELLERDAARQRSRSTGGPGSTFEGQGMVLSAPGSEGFKQDFAKWQELTRQVTLALDEVEIIAVEAAAGEEPRRIAWRPAAMNGPLPNTSSKWTATSRRSRRGNGPDPFRVADSLVARCAAGAWACRDRVLFISATPRSPGSAAASPAGGLARAVAHRRPPLRVPACHPASSGERRRRRSYRCWWTPPAACASPMRTAERGSPRRRQLLTVARPAGAVAHRQA